ncbi:M48 family metalloprotease [Reinekea blandensis]|uniref:M48 family metalloprotease n=1 Tax=Reinekea blandensis TaxID=374838 RepID=UPI00031BE25E|nr:M48 family metalloprotease [Reinekea blandensis]
MERRDFLWFTGLAAGAVVVPPALSGCAYDPVTGESVFSLVSEEQEIEIDRQQSPHQFSADYGANDDTRLNRYVSQVGAAITRTSHRPQMPYSFRVLDANHVNAYTFPGGSMAVTRGILVELDSEAELAALLGHEIGHVNARHSAERATKGLLAQAAVGLAAGAVSNENAQSLVAGVGAISATALLAKYSRNNEREADRLGLDYAVAAGANPKGMIELMAMLNTLHDAQPGALQIMFSSHPMSAERVANAREQVQTVYQNQQGRDLGRERYMDYTAALRKERTLIKTLANADLAVSAGEFQQADQALDQARRIRDDDYALWIISAKSNMGQGRSRSAVADLQKAQTLKPTEALPLYMLGANYLDVGEPDAALSAYRQYQLKLPGNPMVDFFIGYSYEQMGQQPPAAEAYRTFLQQVQQGEQAEHAYRQLLAWGYLS